MKLISLAKNILGSRLFLLCSVLAAVVAVFVFFHIFLPVGRLSNTLLPFRIEKGEGSYHIARNLETAGLIRSRFMFTLYAFLTRDAFKLQSGDYVLSSSLNVPAILDKFVSGDVAKETITIIEGWAIEDIEKYFANKERIIDIPEELEGYLFPDTYHIKASASNEEIVAMMRANFDKKFDDTLREETKKQKKTIDQIVTMASLIEREVQTPKDKQLVSGILWKRLQYGIALQVDAEPDTYKYRGLPAGPIANPGLESIRAALEPEESPYWFYLSARDSTTIFSRTFEEHKAAKARYLP